MESTLHRQLKELYGSGGECEALVDGFRVDARTAGGMLVEVQSNALGPLRVKLERLRECGHRVKVVKPVALSRRIVRRTERGRVVSTRRSPWRGSLLDVFEDLTGLAGWLGEAGSELEILGIEIEEHRVARRRWPGYGVVDRVLLDVCCVHTIRAPADLWDLIGPKRVPEPFTTLDLARVLNRPRWFAQKVAYCLRKSGAARPQGKRRNLIVYARAG